MLVSSQLLSVTKAREVFQYYGYDGMSTSYDKKHLHSSESLTRLLLAGSSARVTSKLYKLSWLKRSLVWILPGLVQDTPSRPLMGTFHVCFSSVSESMSKEKRVNCILLINVLESDTN